MVLNSYLLLRVLSRTQHKVPAIRLPHRPMLQALVKAIDVADSTKLLNCPHIPLFQGPLNGMSMADELQELSDIENPSKLFLPSAVINKKTQRGANSPLSIIETFTHYGKGEIQPAYCSQRKARG